MGEIKDIFHRHTGVYGICISNEQILVIQKILGPYTGQYDLPGGRLERTESLEQAIVREFREETGYTIQNLVNVGVSDFSVMWTMKDKSLEHLHHIAILYKVGIDIGETINSVNAFEGQDSKGSLWVPIGEVNPNNSSPLVLQAVDWFRSGNIPVTRNIFDYRDSN